MNGLAAGINLLHTYCQVDSSPCAERSGWGRLPCDESRFGGSAEVRV